MLGLENSQFSEFLDFTAPSRGTKFFYYYYCTLQLPSDELLSV